MRTLMSIIGVKQGDLLGPGLFVFYIAAITESWRAVSDYPVCLFRSARDHVLTGRSHRAGSPADEFGIVTSEYADDTGVPFCTRGDVEVQTPRLMGHFGRWDMEVHAGKSGKASKSEVLFLVRAGTGVLTTTKLVPIVARQSRVFQ